MDSNRRGSSDEREIQVYEFDNMPARKSKVLPQYIAATAANLLAMSCGCMLGWSSPTLPILKDTKYIVLTEEEESWVASLVALGAVISPFAAGYAASKFGRKKTMLAVALPMLLSWILLACADSPAMLYAGRFIMGMGVGGAFTVIPMYVGEISEDKVRGALGSFMQLLITVGLLYEYCIGPYVSYVVLNIVSAVVPCAFFLVFLFVPESPYFLLGQGRRAEAQKALEWLRGQSVEEVKEELNNMQISVDESAKNRGTLADLVRTRGNKKALMLSLGLVAFQQLSGINAVLFFGQPIFEKTKSEAISPDVAQIIVGVVQVLASGVTPLVVDRLGRRLLLIVSASGMFVSQGVLGLYFYLSSEEYDTSSYNWLPVVSMVIYIAVYCIGFGPLPWAIMGELFPAHVKSLASSLTASVCWILGFIITKFFQNMINLMGEYLPFWIFTVFCGLALVFVFFLLPETKGKSLQEIQEILEK